MALLLNHALIRARKPQCFKNIKGTSNPIFETLLKCPIFQLICKLIIVSSYLYALSASTTFPDSISIYFKTDAFNLGKIISPSMNRQLLYTATCILGRILMGLYWQFKNIGHRNKRDAIQWLLVATIKPLLVKGKVLSLFQSELVIIAKQKKAKRFGVLNQNSIMSFPSCIHRAIS